MTLVEELLAALRTEREHQENLVKRVGTGSTLHVIHTQLAASYRRLEEQLERRLRDENRVLPSEGA